MANKPVLLLIAALFYILPASVNVAAEDITSRYNLPSIKRAPDNSIAGSILKKAKVLKYAEEVPVKYTEIMDVEKYVSNLKASIKKQTGTIGKNYKPVQFSGKTAKELNSFLKDMPYGNKIEIILTERVLILDEPIILRSNTIINGMSARLEAGSVDIAIIADSIEHAGLKNMSIESPRVCGIMFLNAARCVINNITVSKGHDKGLVIRGNSRFMHIADSIFSENQRGGIMVQDGSNHILISNCRVSGGKNSSNWSAGIVITSVFSSKKFGIRDAFDGRYFYPKDLSFKKTRVPFKNIIEAAHIHNNQSSGIYIDGGNGNVLLGNYLTQNDKEGLCIDFYATANIVEANVLIGNGFRKFQSDDDLRYDAVFNFGRLADGSAASKLPNISLDNAAYNIIVRNSISGAAGDGVKIVRSGFRNIIGLNTITDNNAMGNIVFSFFGVLLGSAGSDTPNDTSGLDVFPSIENIVFGNTIYGPHHSGILIDHGSVYNDIFDNMVMKQKEQPLIQQSNPNSIVGNNFDIAETQKKGKFISKKKLLLGSAVLSISVIVLISILVIRYYKKVSGNKPKSSQP